MNAIPEGFEPLETKSPFFLNVGPLYRRVQGDQICIGLRIEEHHCNSGGRLHGAMVCTLADAALGQNIGYAFLKNGAFDKIVGRDQAGSPMATVSMSTDFVGTAKLGDWVEVHVDVQRAGMRMAFANAYLVCGDERIARVSGVFQIIAK